MNGWQFALRSFLHYWRTNLAVIIGAAVGTAVLTGALIVGDSVRNSLLRLAIDRLGKADYILLSDQFCSESLAEKIKSSSGFSDHFEETVPTILLSQAAAEFKNGDKTTRSANVNLIGCNSDFWKLETVSNFEIELIDRSIALNETLANDLGVKVGDELILRFGRVDNVAGDSPLVDKSDVGRSLVDLKVARIIPTEGLGRFSLNPSQNLPRNAFVPLKLLQRELDQDARVNAIFVSSNRKDSAPSEADHDFITTAIRPTIDDASFKFDKVEGTYYDKSSNQQKTSFEYFRLTTEKMVFPESASSLILQELKDLQPQPVFTYLANSIGNIASKADPIPYSLVTAVDSTEELGPLIDDHGSHVESLKANEIVLNRWAAEDQDAFPGATVSVSYFDPETTHGKTNEKTSEFQVVAIVPLMEPLQGFENGDPAKYMEPIPWSNDPKLTPTVRGITDQESIADWDAPFPFDYGRIRKRRPRDDNYWERFRTTPKAFVSFETGKKLWGSRFGHVTSFRFAANQSSFESMRDRIEGMLASDLASFGFRLTPIKANGIKAAKGTTPFNLLFLGFSFFIMAAAIMLVALLFRLGIEQRSSDTGLLMAVGISKKKVATLSLAEGGIVGFVGAILGVILGLGYAKLMIIGLRTRWVDAVVTPFLNLHVTPLSLILGLLIGIGITIATILWTLYQSRKVTMRQLMSGDFDDPVSSVKMNKVQSLVVPIVMFVIAAVTGIMGISLSGEAQAGAFFGCGAAVLTGLLLLVRRWLRQSLTNLRFENARHFDELDLVVRNTARNSNRSVLTIGLMASACFLIIAISAFRLTPTKEGTGGFNVLATSELPIYENLGDPEERKQILGTHAPLFENAKILSFRYQPGEDASCRNLYQTQSPRLLGVTDAIIKHFDSSDGQFNFSGSAAESDEEIKNPWRLLSKKSAPGNPIPVVLDKNTAMYSLHKYGGIGEEFELDYGSNRRISFKVVGLLSNSVLQGSLLVNADDLLENFPLVTAFQYFLMDVDPAKRDKAMQQLEETFSAEGLDAIKTDELLNDLLAVQNTYLSTFQSLGGLGLLLGTFGLVAVQLRNVWRRRAEIALLRATGFPQSRISRLILLEHGLLLLGGLGIGTFAALLAVLPHIVFGGANIPVFATMRLILVIFVVGLATGFLAVRNSSRLPILQSLRGS